MATWRLMSVALAATLAVVALLVLQGVGWAPAQAASGTVSGANCTRNGIQAQISAAPTGGVITFNCASPTIAISPTLVITANTTLDGSNNGNPIILDGGNVTRIISLTPGVALTLTNITLQRGNAGSGMTNHGGAVHGGDTTRVTLLNARVLTNTAGGDGGGVRAGVAVVTNTQVVSNTAVYWGGGLFAYGAVTVSGSSFVSNTAHVLGGGLYANSGAVTGSSFVSNTAQNGNGGGLYAVSAATVMSSSFVSNTAVYWGGGLYASGPATVSASSFLSNTAGDRGGGLYADGAVTVTGSSFLSNTAGDRGGGLFADGAVTVTGSSFVSNTARTGSGGGLWAFGPATVTTSSFVSNTAARNGGGLLAGGAATVMGSSFLSNTAARNGGGLFASVAAMVSNTRFINNTARSEGGGLAADGAATVMGSSFVSNTADHGGGLAADGAATVMGSSFVSNTAQTGGGLRAGSALSLTNSTLSSNRAISSGGAISLVADSPVSVALAYVTVVSNTAPDAAIAARVAQTPTIRGSVFQHGASSANCFRVTALGPDGVVATDTSCGNASATSAASINLGPLADNGGGQFLDGSALLTHLPQPGSVLIGGMPGCVPGVTTDQRGVARPGAGCDVGALEVGRQPVYLSLSPNTAPAGSPTTVVTATGSGFIPGTVLLWNGSPRATTVLSATTLTATIPATDLASATVATTTLRYGADPTSVATTTLPFTVTLNSQTITFPNPGTQDPTSLPSSIPVTATASSGLPVSLTSQTSGVCTVSGFTVTLLAGGTCALVANQGGNTVFAPASPVTQSFTVNAPSGGGGGGGGGTTLTGTGQIVIATGFRNQPLGQ